MIREDENLPKSVTMSKDRRADVVASALGLELRAIRAKFIAAGGQLLSRDELSKEMAERRGGVTGPTHEDENLR